MGSNKYIITKNKYWPVFKQDPPKVIIIGLSVFTLMFQNEKGHCACPVLRTYVCPLCRGTGDAAHTLKYCPLNTVTRGDPIAAGLPPGKVTNWKDIANKLAMIQ